MNTSFGENKKIFLGAPSDFKINKRIKEHLEKLGFEVILYDYEYRWNIPFKDVLIHNYKKIFEKDRTYKTRIRVVRNKTWQKKYEDEITKKNQHFDYSLFIRPDQYSIDFAKKISDLSDRSAAYQWDGMDRFPEVKEYINFFTYLYVFDEHDLAQYPNAKFLTNFYFEDDHEEHAIQDIFFIGSYLPERKELLNAIAKRFLDAGLKTSINIFSLDKKLRKEDLYFTVTDKYYTFEENQENIRRSRFVLDISNSVHHGLSFRTFESLGYRKKLITNNVLVKKYDFYNPNNIFIFDNPSMEGLEDFLKRPYEELPQEIIGKYSFANWIKYVLNIEPHLPINAQ